MLSIAACALLGFAASAQAQTIRWVPEAGTHGYHYEAITQVPDAPGNGYRLDYDLVSDGKGGLVAVVKAAQHRQGSDWYDVDIEDECRTALGAQGKELARVTLSPITPEAAKLGTAFLPDCAPRDIFFPVTDILRVSLYQVAPQFALAKLTKPGDSARFAGHSLDIDRLKTSIKLESPGGTVTFAVLLPGRATVEWASDPTAITMVHRGAYMGADVTLTGNETSVYRLDIDPATGVLLGAATTSDKFDATMSLPGDYSRPLPVTQEVKITPLP
jgi:hypothetical protein